MKKIIIIIPVLNEAKLIENFYKSLRKKCLQFNNYEFKILFVVDKSDDDTEKLVIKFCKEDKYCSCIIMNDIYGHQESLYAGLENAKNFDIIVTMDGDFQHPIDLIDKMIFEYENGSDAVFTSKKIKYEKKIIITFLSNFFYIIFNFLSETKLVNNSSDFRLITKKLLKKFFKKKWNYVPFLRGELLKLSDNKKILGYSAAERIKGESKFTFWKLFKLAIEGLFSFSNRAIKIVFFSFIVFLICKIYFLDLLINLNNELFHSLIHFFLNLLLFFHIIIFIYWSKLKLDIRNKSKYKIYEIKKKINI